MEFLNENNLESWKNFVKEQKNIPPQYSIKWKDAIEKTYKNCVGHYYLDVEKGSAKTILPFFLIKSEIFGSKLVSQPFLDFGGLQGEFCEEFISKVIQNLKGEFEGKIKHIEIRLNNFLPNYKEIENSLLKLDFKKESKKNQFILKLEDEKILWEKFDRITRKAIKKANKSILELKEMENKKEFDTFYELYLKSMKNFGTPQHSPDFFLNLFKYAKDNFKGLNCYKDGELIGSLIVLYSKDYMYAVFNFSDYKFLKYQPNDLLYWEMIRWAIKKEIKYFDFGQCDATAEKDTHAGGIYRFKSKWKAKLYEKNYFYYSFDKKPSEKSNKKNKNRNLIKIWKTLPLPIIKKIGPSIASQLAL